MSTLGAAVLLVAAVSAGAGVALLWWPWRLSFQLEGRGEPSGAWALVGGASLGPVSVTAVAAAGVVPQLQLYCWNRRLVQRSLTALRARRGAPGVPAPLLPRLRRLGARLRRHVDVGELLWFLAGERRRVRLESGVLELDFSFRDVALTGKLLGAVQLLDGVLPATLRVTARPRWEFEDRAAGGLRGVLAFWPGLLLVETLWWVLRYARLRPRAKEVQGDGSTR